MKIIGIGYKKQSGKNTFAKFMSTYIRCTAPKIRVKEISFAAKLKEVAYQLYGWGDLKKGIYYETRPELKEIVLPKLGLTPRIIWIGIGNALREVRSDTWIDFALKNIKADILIITDVRFRNEAKAIKVAGGKLVKIIRPNIPIGTDPAEVDLDSWLTWDYIIGNHNDLQQLNLAAEEIASTLL